MDEILGQRPDRHGHRGLEKMREPPRASGWGRIIVQSVVPGSGKSSLEIFTSRPLTSLTTLPPRYHFLLILFSLLSLLLLLLVMSVRRRLSKRRPSSTKEQAQIAKSPPSNEPIPEEIFPDGSTPQHQQQQLPRHRTPPTKSELDKVADYYVEDEHGNKVPFKDLYTEKPRVLIIFVRHFFCGVCSLPPPPPSPSY